MAKIVCVKIGWKHTWEKKKIISESNRSTWQNKSTILSVSQSQIYHSSLEVKISLWMSLPCFYAFDRSANEHPDPANKNGYKWNHHFWQHKVLPNSPSVQSSLIHHIHTPWQNIHTNLALLGHCGKSLLQHFSVKSLVIALYIFILLPLDFMNLDLRRRLSISAAGQSDSSTTAPGEVWSRVIAVGT